MIADNRFAVFAPPLPATVQNRNVGCLLAGTSPCVPLTEDNISFTLLFAPAEPHERECAEFLDVPVLPQYICRVRAAAAAVAESMGFTRAACEDITLAVGEAMNNAVFHSSRGPDADEADFVRMWLMPSAQPRRHGLAITIVNTGCFTPRGEAWDTMPDPREMTGNGRGLALMSRLMDSVTVREWNGKTIVRLWKQKNAPAGDAMAAYFAEDKAT